MKDDLRQRLLDSVGALRAQQRLPRESLPIREEVFATVKTGGRYHCRFAWLWRERSSTPEMSMRVWAEVEGVWEPVAKAGMRIVLRDVPAFAEAFAVALERMFVSDEGLRVLPPSSGADVKGDPGSVDAGVR